MSLKNEIIVDTVPDSQISVIFVKSAIEENEKIYGPIFTRIASEHALQFEAEKLMDKPPENIQNLQEVTNYIINNLDKYPNGYCALMYGIAKAESKLQGSTGAGSKRSAFSAMKSIIESSGMLNSVIGTTGDLFEALDKFEEIGKMVKTAIPLRFIRGENNEVTMVSKNCPYKDACRAFINEGIGRLVGGQECINIICHAAVAEIITKKRFDYKLYEFDKPECRGKIFEV
ncbi:MAG: hypothetical protein ACUVXA_11745 [Candidatus Jordarchaeum sp.]|uniref:hypothetical protein n=1 Tax=Candidatus Jordarchaeum sp. TaxID=2823881 RepID=UPI004049BDF5